jgi:phosphorylcholine metabolism protein LicD
MYANSNSCPEDLKCPELHHALLKAMLARIHDTFVKEQIQYFVEGGTLLGLIRESNLIKIDDDIDLGIFDKQFDKASKALKNMCENFKIVAQDEAKNSTEYKVEFWKQDNGQKSMLKVYIPNLWAENSVSKKIFGTPTIDFFSYTKAGDKIKLASHSHRLEFPNCYFSKNEIFPLTLRKLDFLDVFSPQNPYPYLFRYYGKDCLTKIKIDCRKADSPQNKDRNAIVM